MTRYKIDNRTLQLLNAQVNLTETFNHVLRTVSKRECLAFRLKAERGSKKSTFVVELGSERHTLTLQNDKKMHLKLADFVEEIANGPFYTSNTSELLRRPHASREYGRFEVSDKQRVFELVRTGGVLNLDMGFDYPIIIALHRTHSRSGVTTILSIGNTSPHTRCFTVYGSDVEIYGKVSESINHLAAAATPAAHAA
jgi:Txe/YoeB family toxin of Txe-Axe toxin-antitoxin module